MSTPNAQEPAAVVQESATPAPAKAEEVVVVEESQIPSTTRFDALCEEIFKECDCEKSKPKAKGKKDAGFRKVYKEMDEHGEEGLELPPIEDEVPEEGGRMISIPVELAEEIASYLDDSMGDEDLADPDSSDFDIPVEGVDYDKVRSRMADLKETGSAKVNNKTKKSAGKQGVCAVDSKARTGKAELLRVKLGSHLACGSAKQKNDTAVGSQVINK